MNIKEMKEALFERKGDLERRIEACEKELEGHKFELSQVEPLARYYDELHYDPIVEEKNVTLKMMNAAEEKAKPKKAAKAKKEEAPKAKTKSKRENHNPSTGKSKYYDYFDIIFDGAKDGLTLKEISEKITELTGKKLTDATIFSPCKLATEYGFMTKDKDKKYYWLGTGEEKKPTIETVKAHIVVNDAPVEAVEPAGATETSELIHLPASVIKAATKPYNREQFRPWLNQEPREPKDV